jgi:hypothetical protein
LIRQAPYMRQRHRAYTQKHGQYGDPPGLPLLLKNNKNKLKSGSQKIVHFDTNFSILLSGRTCRVLSSIQRFKLNVLSRWLRRDSCGQFKQGTWIGSGVKHLASCLTEDLTKSVSHDYRNTERWTGTLPNTAWQYMRYIWNAGYSGNVIYFNYCETNLFDSNWLTALGLKLFRPLVLLIGASDMAGWRHWHESQACQSNKTKLASVLW